jgi:phenylpropionate dioxygenase-like ring-hydroxylating dioxygenase large terminal subunit
MRHDEQVRLIRLALESIQRGSPPLEETYTRNDPRAYVSETRAIRERDILFHNYPIVAGFSSRVRDPGDFFADDLSPIPTLVARGEDGRLRAFANICRHRGSRLASGNGSGANRFVCPYHAWSYDLEGKLRAIPEEYGFAGIDKERHCLTAFPVEERYGLVWVLPSGGALDIESYLGAMATDLDTYNISDFAVADQRVVRRRMNWKLVSDTFWEAYHIKMLHRTTVAPLFVRNLALYDGFGMNHRLVGIRNSIESLRGKPEPEWDLVPHATILMNLFPNTICVMQSDHVETYRVFPADGKVNESFTEVTVLTPPHDSANSRWKKIMDLLIGVIEQDFEVGENIQRNFESGAINEVVYGRYEPALEHFHRAIRRALGEPERL